MVRLCSSILGEMEERQEAEPLVVHKFKWRTQMVELAAKEVTKASHKVLGSTEIHVRRCALGNNKCINGEPCQVFETGIKEGL